MLCILWQLGATAQTPTPASPTASLGVSVYRDGVPIAGLSVAQVAASAQTDFSAFDASKTYNTVWNAPIWLRLRLRLRIDTASAQAASLWTLDFNKPFIDKVVLHAAQGDGTWRQQSAGDGLAHKAWPKQSLTPQFNLPELAAGQHDFYVQLYNSVPLRMAVTLLPSEEASAHTQNTFLIAGMMAGLLVFMCIASCVLGINYRDSACLWYAAYAGAVLLLTLSYMGVGNYALWTDSIWLRGNGNVMFILAAVALQLQFCRAMFLVPASPAWMRYGVHLLSAFCMVSIVLIVLWFNFATQMVFFVVPVLLSTLAMVALVVSNVRSQRITAWLWTVAYAPLILLVVMAIADNMGYRSVPWLPFNAPLYALLFEMPVLLIALNLHAKAQHAKVVRKQTLASTDPTTGFVASHAFAASLERLWRASIVTGQDLALAYVQLMPQPPHEAQRTKPGAEHSVARVVRLMRTVICEHDVVAHVDKDLFAMLMPNMPVGDNLSARLTRLVALAAMTDKDAGGPIRFHMVATTQRSFAGTVQQVDTALRHKLNKTDGWEKKAIRFVRKRPLYHPAASRMEGESFSQFWDRAAQASIESTPTTRPNLL